MTVKRHAAIKLTGAPVAAPAILRADGALTSSESIKVSAG